MIYGGNYKLEVKLDLKADYGQVRLSQYNNGIFWQLVEQNTAAAEELRGLMRAVGIEAFANKTWGPKGAT